MGNAPEDREINIMRMKICALARAARCREMSRGGGVKAFAAVLIAVCTLAIAAGEECSEGSDDSGSEEVMDPGYTLTYSYDDGAQTATVTGCTITATESVDIVIPDTDPEKNYKITAINTNAFNGKEIGSVTFGNNLKTIGEGAFGGSGIKAVEIPAGVSVGMTAFMRCSNLTKVILNAGVDMSDGYDAGYQTGVFASCKNLESVEVKDGVTKIPSFAFEYCTKLNEINFPTTLTKIGERAFLETAVTAIDVPGGVTEIGDDAFASCGSLKTVRIGAGEKTIGKECFQECYSMETLEIGEGIKEIPDFCFLDAGEQAEDTMTVAIPSTVAKIGRMAFYKSNVGSVSILGSTVMGDEAFKESALQSIEMKAVVTFGTSVFNGCTSLTTVTLADEQTAIPENTFLGCSALKHVTFPDGLTMIGQGAFSGTALESVEIKAGVTYGTWAFSGCKGLRNITINFGATMGDALFSGCSLDGVTLDLTLADGLTAIPADTFYGCKGLKAVTFPDSLRTIGNGAFNDTGLTDVTFPDGLTEIGPYAFASAPLTSVTWGSSIPTIQDSAFYREFYEKVNGYSWSYPDKIDYRDPAQAGELQNSTFTCTDSDESKLVKVSDLTLEYPDETKVVQKHNGIYLNPSDFETPSASGKTFLYWKASDGTAVKDSDQYKMPDGGTTLEPVWFDGTDLLIFESDNYTVIGEEYVSLTGGSAKISTKAENTGGIFAGWTCERDGKTVLYSYDATFECSEGIGVVRMAPYFYYEPSEWNTNYTATYDYGEGSGDVQSQAVSGDFCGEYSNGYIALPTSHDVRYDGYRLVGWKIGDGSIEGPYYQLAGDVTVAAVWEPATAITYQSSDGTVIGTQKAVAGQVVKLDDGRNISGTELPLVGWKVGGSGDIVYGLGTDYMVGSDAVFVTVWADAADVLVYVTDGGKLTGSTCTPIEGGAAVLESAVEKDGYMFLGWLMTDSGGSTVAYAPGMTISASGVVRLAAYLVEDGTAVSEISYDLGGGSGISSQKAVAGQLIALPTSRDVHREGYSLVGWEVSTSTAGAMTSLGAEPVSLGGEAITGPYYTVTSESVTISAVWESDAPSPSPEPSWWDDDDESIVIPSGNTGSSTSEGTDKTVAVAIAAAVAAALMTVLVFVDPRRK